MGSITFFQGMVCRMTKMNVTFSMGNGVSNTALKFFPQKTPYRLNESQKTSYWTNCFKKKNRFTHVWTGTNHVNFIKIGSKLRPVSWQNALLFEKSWHECKIPSFLPKAMCIESDYGLTKMRCSLSTFMALYSRRFWQNTWTLPDQRAMVTKLQHCGNLLR